MESKVCKKCGVEKNLNEFYSSGQGSKRSDCKACSAAYRKVYAASHGEYLKKVRREFYKENKARERSTNLAWRANNSETLEQIAKRFAEANPDYHKNWRTENRGKRNAYRAKRLLQIQATGSFTASEWESLKLLYNGQCLSCLNSEPHITLTVDHVMPLSKGGPNTIDNIQPLCGPCNSRKNASFKDYRPDYAAARDTGELPAR